MIIRTKESSQWTSTSLREACKQRLVQKKNIPQLTLELADLKTELTDDPDSIIDKIETVLLKQTLCIQNTFKQIEARQVHGAD